MPRVSNFASDAIFQKYPDRDRYYRYYWILSHDIMSHVLWGIDRTQVGFDPLSCVAREIILQSRYRTAPPRHSLQ